MLTDLLGRAAEILAGAVLGADETRAADFRLGDRRDFSGVGALCRHSYRCFRETGSSAGSASAVSLFRIRAPAMGQLLDPPLTHHQPTISVPA